MAINLNKEIVINAAGAAFTPAKGESDLWSGYIQAAGHVATAIVKRKDMVNKIKSSMDKITIPTDIPFIKDLAQSIKKDAVELRISEAEAQQQLNDLILDVKQYLPATNERLAYIDKNGLSRGVNRIDENFALGLSLGELNTPITVTKDGVSTSFGTFFTVDPNTRKLMVRDPAGGWIRPSQLLAITENMPTADLGNEANTLLANFAGESFLPGKTSKWASERDKVNIKLNKLFANKKVLYSTLLDNPMGFDVTNHLDDTKNFTWEEWYLNEDNLGLTATQKATYDAEIAKVGAGEPDGALREEMKAEARSIIVKGLMDDDTDLMEDVKRFVKEIYDHKNPGDEEVITIVSRETPVSGFKIKGKLNETEKQDLEVVNSVENAFMELSKLDLKEIGEFSEESVVNSVAMDGKVQLVRIAPDPNDPDKARFIFRQNMYGETDGQGNEKVKNLSSSFFYPITNDGLKQIVQEVITNSPNGVGIYSRVYRQYKAHPFK